MKASRIENGVYAAALTPMHGNLRCHDTLLTEHCLQLINRGCQGVVLFGTTGEGASFSVGEKKQALRQVISHGLDPQKIIVGNGSACLTDTVDLALATIEQRCLGSLIAPPCFYKNVLEEGVIAFYREVIRRVANPHLRIILYHIPQYTGVPITVNTVKTLCTEFPDIVVGIKESEGNLSLVKDLLATVPQCQVFVGKELHLPQAIAYGASGTICGMANLWPELICSLYKGASTAELEKVIATIGNQPFIAACKALLAESNDPTWRFVRPPLVSLKGKS